MDILAKIIETLAWPSTIIIVVMLLRSPLSELVPTLRKLKYKDLELEFEREANKILSEAERDLPEIPEEPKPVLEDNGIRFCIRQEEPVTNILNQWRDLEIKMREIASGKGLKTGRSIRSLISELKSNGAISEEVAKITLDLAALRNRVTHTDEEVITHEVSSAYSNSIKRVKLAIEPRSA